MTTFTRSLTVRPAFDKVHTDPTKNYGVHGCDLVFQVVTPEKEGLTYVVFTNWFLPQTEARLERTTMHRSLYKPISAGCDGHFHTPQYDGQSPVPACHITGGECYSDGTSITDDLFGILLEKGSDGLFEALEARFIRWKSRTIPEAGG